MPYSPRPPTTSSTRPCGLSRTAPHFDWRHGRSFPISPARSTLPEFATLVVADLHLEKASSLARRGVHLPPYDTRATLEQLDGRWRPVEAAAAGFSRRQLPRRRGGERDRRRRSRALSSHRRGGGDDLDRRQSRSRPARRNLRGSIAARSLARPAAALRHEPESLAEAARNRRPPASGRRRRRSAGARIRCKCFIGRRRPHGDAGLRQLHRRARC